MRVLSVGSLPPAWGGRTYGGVATLHATLLEGFLEPACPVEVVGAIAPDPIERELPIPVFSRSPDEQTADFYERLLDRLEPDVVVMHHFAHTIGVTHAHLEDPPPAIGIAHSWHQVTFRDGEERQRAWETTAEALGGLAGLAFMSHHCLQEGKALGFSYPPIVETIYHPLQPLYAATEVDARLDSFDRRGVAYLGSLIPRKNPTALVEVAARLPEVELVFAGHGEMEGELRSLIAARELSGRVEVRHLNDLQVRDLLLRSRVMCLPSHSETFGLAYIEALACGTPVVGFGPTLREIRDQVGIEIGEPLEENSAEAVAAAIERVQETAWNRCELRRRTLDSFGWRGVTGRYVDLISRVVSPDPAPDQLAGSQATAICVLGMSRSGTSLTARILNLAGVYLGADDELLGGELSHIPSEDRDNARAANPNGFWEHYRLMRLSERILRRLGGNWREPPPLPPGWEASEELAEEREEARELLGDNFSGHTLWGWKDPRLSLTLPFWLQVVPELRCVICLRDPLEVASSLQKRDGLPLEQGLELWLTYVARALVNSAGRPRLLVPFDTYFDDAEAATQSLARFAGREDALGGATAKREVEEAIDPTLWRNRAETVGAAAGLVGAEVASLNLIARLLAVAPESNPATAELHDAVDAYASRLLEARASLEPAG